MNTLIVSAPGRICLFGEHQDYLGLPVIAAAINLRISIAGVRADHGMMRMSMPDMGGSVEIDPSTTVAYSRERDYLASCVNVLRRKGLRWPQGYDIVMHGEIPINAGVSSSSAMVVAWLHFLLHAADPATSCTDTELAELGYLAEVREFDEPGGMMDHFCSALGGILAIRTTPPFDATRIDLPLSGFVLANSCQPKATLETLGRNRRDVTDGIGRMQKLLPSFDLSATSLAEADPLIGRLPHDPARRLRANLVNRDLAQEARAALDAGDAATLGRLLYAHHVQLRDGLDLSTEKIERMMDAALDAGALGGKINGSGGGGCMFAYAPGREADVVEAIRRAGGVPYVVRVDDGARVEE